jgi:hypothetical protein
MFLFIWKYVSNFKSNDNTFIQIKVDDKFITDPKNIADAFTDHFISIFSTSYPAVIAPHSVTIDSLPLPRKSVKL